MGPHVGGSHRGAEQRDRRQERGTITHHNDTRHHGRRGDRGDDRSPAGPPATRRGRRRGSGQGGEEGGQARRQGKARARKKPEPEPEEEPGPTREEVRQALKDYAALESKSAAIKILKAHDASSITELDEDEFLSVLEDCGVEWEPEGDD